MRYIASLPKALLFKAPLPLSLFAFLTVLLATPGYMSTCVTLSITSKLPLPDVSSHLEHLMNGYGSLPLGKTLSLLPRLPTNNKYTLKKKKRFAYIFYKPGVFVCMYILPPEKAIRFHKSYMLPRGCWELNSGPQEEQQCF